MIFEVPSVSILELNVMKGPHCIRMWYRWITNYPIYLPYVWGWFAQPSNPALLFCAKRDRHVVSGTILEEILWLHIHGLFLCIMEIFLYKPSYFVKLGMWLSKQNTKCKLNCPYMGWCCLWVVKGLNMKTPSNFFGHMYRQLPSPLCQGMCSLVYRIDKLFIPWH